MTKQQFPAIIDVIGKNVRDYKAALDEAQRLAGRESLDADERQRFAEAVQYLQENNATAHLLSSDDRATLDAVVEAHAQSIVPVTSSIGDITAEYILVRNISPVDADGNVLWTYPELYVAKDIVRHQNGSQVNKTSYDWVHSFDQSGGGIFLPSPADTCNILAALFANKDDAEVGKVLMQYKDKGNDYGWQAQNGIVDFGTQEVIHYPAAADFRKDVSVNASKKRTALSFDKLGLGDGYLKETLDITVQRRYVQQWSGLKDPSVLVGIGDYFSKSAYVLISGGKNKKAAWWSCGISYFLLDANDDLGYSSAARGVRRTP